MSDNTFLPASYEVPQKAGSYMKFLEGENKFRILASPILGYETWEDLPDGSRKPKRTPMDKPFSVNEVEGGDPNNVKHFWAMPVYNYAEEKVQILEITQKGIQKSLRALAKDEDWGSPVSYDLVVTRTGQKLETEYQVQPKPAKALSSAIVEAYKAINIDLTALYRGDDPFQQNEKVEVDPKDVEEAFS